MTTQAVGPAQQAVEEPIDFDLESPSTGGAWRRASSIAYPTAGIVIGILFWELVTHGFGVPAYLLPPPETVVGAMWAQREVLLSHAVYTAQEVVLGFLVSAFLGILISLLLFASRPLNRMVYPLLVASQSIPKVAVAPVFIVWLGFGPMSKLLIAFLMAFFPVVISTTIGLQAVPEEMLFLARSMGAGRFRTFWKIRLPAALPNIMGGLKVAVTLAVVGAVVGEFVGADHGLGYLIQVSGGSLNIPLMWAGVLGLVILGIGSYLIVEGLEAVIVPGPKRSSGGQSEA